MKFPIPLEISVKNTFDKESNESQSIENEVTDSTTIVDSCVQDNHQKQEQGGIDQYDPDNAESRDKTEEQVVSVFNLTESLDDTETFMESFTMDSFFKKKDTRNTPSVTSPQKVSPKNNVESPLNIVESLSNDQNGDDFLDTESPMPLETSSPRRMNGQFDNFEEDQREAPSKLPTVQLHHHENNTITHRQHDKQQQQQSHRNQLMRHLNSRNDVPADDDEDKISPALKRRLRDFAFAQQKRRETYGEKNPWGIIGLYDHLTGIRTDIEWAEDAAWRRENNEPYLSWSDFEQAKDTGFNQPFFTYIIMFICTGCLILSIGVNGWKVEPLSINPMIGPSAQTLIDVGAKQTSLIVKENQWFRIFSPMVLHAGIIHFVLNMIALWFIGYAVEMNHGFFAIAILFIVPAIGGTLLSALFLPEYISVGASGGIFGLIGGCIADIVTNWNLLFSKEVNTSNHGQRFRNFKVLVWLLLDIFLNVLIGLTPFVDNFTHLGGMIYGFLCGLSKLERLSKAFFGVQKGLISKFQTGLVRFFGTIMSIVLIGITLLLLIKSDGERLTSCRGCRYVSCVPFPFWADYEDKWWYCDDCDLVRADARLNTVTNTYSSMNLTCPDGEVIFIDLSLGNVGGDQSFLQKRLPTYCRDSCNSLFAN